MGERRTDEDPGQQAPAPGGAQAHDNGIEAGVEDPDAAYADGADSLYDTPAAYDVEDSEPDLTPAEPPASSDSSYFRTHTVSRGDTLSRISNKYNVRMSAIIEANNIKNKNLLVVGQKLIIPSR